MKLNITGDEKSEPINFFLSDLKNTFLDINTSNILTYHEKLYLYRKKCSILAFSKYFYYGVVKSTEEKSKY